MIAIFNNDGWDNILIDDNHISNNIKRGKIFEYPRTQAAYQVTVVSEKYNFCICKILNCKDCTFYNQLGNESWSCKQKIFRFNYGVGCNFYKDE